MSVCMWSDGHTGTQVAGRSGRSGGRTGGQEDRSQVTGFARRTGTAAQIHRHRRRFEDLGFLTEDLGADV